ncbi:MAG TPA: hypothetical protein VL989_00205 [Candidatus Sulfotelmatobacter sp.]|nr:hypothetical protein [Candidatus Sulfotelmatobacter sp.]
MSQLVKLVVTVPEDHADELRQTIGEVEGGRIGNYTHTSFSIKGIGRFKPGPEANPRIGQVGKLEEVPEERIEVTCEQDKLNNIIVAIRRAHPYEEPAIDIYPLLLE